MKILVTGSFGMFGLNVVPALVADRHDIRAMDLKIGRDCRRRADAEMYCNGIDVVVHLAAIPWGMPKYTARDYWRTNVQATAVMVDAAVTCGVKRFVLASSTGYYGFQRGWPFDDDTAYVDDLNVVQRYGICINPERMPSMDADQRSRLHYMTSKVGAETALAARAIGGEIEGVVLRFAPVTPEPYEWGLWCRKPTAVAAVQKAVTMDVYRPLSTFNVGEPCAILPELLST